MRRGCRRVSACLLCCLCLSLRPAAAQDPPSTKRRVTLLEMYREALVRNEEIQIAQQGVFRSEKEVNRALGALLPQLSLESQYLRRPDNLFAPVPPFGSFLLRSAQEEQLNLTLTQPLYTGGRASAAYRIAKQGVAASRYDLSNTSDQLLFSVAQAYYSALKARKNIAIQESEVTRLEAHLRESERRFQVGEVTRTVVLRSAAGLSGAKANLVRAQNDFDTAKNQLSLLTKVAPDFDPEEPGPLTAPNEDEPELVRRALKNRPDLARQRLNEQSAREGVISARGGFLPSLALQGNFNWLDQSPPSSFLLRNDRSALIVLNFPLFEGGIRIAELAQARSRVREVELQESLLEAQIAVEIRNDLMTVGAITSTLANLKDQMAFARDNFTMISRQFSVGLATNIDVLDANSTLIDAERQYANALYDRELAILQIYRSLGLFAEESGL